MYFARYLEIGRCLINFFQKRNLADSKSVEKLPLALTKPGFEMADVSLFCSEEVLIKKSGKQAHAKLYLPSLSCPTSAAGRSGHAVKRFGYFCLIAYM